MLFRQVHELLFFLIMLFEAADTLLECMCGNAKGHVISWKHTQKQFLKPPWYHATSTDATPDGTWLKRAPGGSSGNGRGSYAGKGVPRKEYFEDQMEHTSWKDWKSNVKTYGLYQSFLFKGHMFRFQRFVLGLFVVAQVLYSQAVLCYVRC